MRYDCGGPDDIVGRRSSTRVGVRDSLKRPLDFAENNSNAGPFPLRDPRTRMPHSAPLGRMREIYKFIFGKNEQAPPPYDRTVLPWVPPFWHAARLPAWRRNATKLRALRRIAW